MKKKRNKPIKPNEFKLFIYLILFRLSLCLIAFYCIFTMDLMQSILIIIFLYLVNICTDGIHKSITYWSKIKAKQLAAQLQKEKEKKLREEIAQKAIEAQKEAAKKYFDEKLSALAKKDFNQEI